MSSRPPVDAVRIRTFLDELGGRYRGTGRVFLVGGTTLVLEGFRLQTLDIDIAFDLPEGSHGEFVRVVKDLKDWMQINVEEASPADFIPLPAGSESRARYIGRFGQLEVYHFDPYAVSLSKVERGRDGDFDDIVALLRHGWIEWSVLESQFQEIQPAYEAKSLKADPVAYRGKFEVLRARWDAAGG